MLLTLPARRRTLLKSHICYLALINGLDHITLKLICNFGSHLLPGKKCGLKSHPLPGYPNHIRASLKAILNYTYYPANKKVVLSHTCYPANQITSCTLVTGNFASHPLPGWPQCWSRSHLLPGKPRNWSWITHYPASQAHHLPVKTLRQFQITLYPAIYTGSLQSNSLPGIPDHITYRSKHKGNSKSHLSDVGSHREGAATYALIMTYQNHLWNSLAPAESAVVSLHPAIETWLIRDDIKREGILVPMICCSIQKGAVIANAWNRVRASTSERE